MFRRKINEIRMAFFARIILILGGLNYLYMGFFSKTGFFFLTPQLVNKNVINMIFIFIGLVSLYLFFNRDYYLPFLGETIVPTISPLKKNNKNILKTTIKNLPPNSTVIYWAARSGEDTQLMTDPYIAYGDYTNSGVVKSNEKGEAELEYECPMKYTVSKFGITKKLLHRHIHYRYMDPNLPGFLSKIKTIYLNGNCVNYVV